MDNGETGAANRCGRARCDARGGVWRGLWALPALLACLLPFGGCAAMSVRPDGTGDSLGDMAYDVNPERGYTVYVREGEAYAPYLVLTDRYGGHALLLRAHLLDELRVYNPNGRNSAAYEDSQIDEFLNQTFLTLLRPALQEKIVESEITAAAPSALGVAGTETVRITRKVFLLSYTEIGMPASSVIPAEGEALAFFQTAERRVARFADGAAGSWWLRSADTWHDNVVIGVGPDASVGGGGVSTPGGVRPAFCVGREAAVAESEEILPGQTVYVLN